MWWPSSWPVVDGSAQGLVGFCVSARTKTEIADQLLSSLPRYMVPDPIEVMESLPVNINGKVDRRALFLRLEEGRATAARSAASVTAGAAE